MDGMKIRLHDAARRAFPLAPISVGRASAAEFIIADAPGGITDLRMHFTKPGADGAEYAVIGRPCGVNEWKVYASGLNFMEVGRCGYEVTAVDWRGNAVWLGRGSLEVVAAALHDSGGEAPIVPADTYIRNPATGLWHSLTVEVDESGALVPVLGEGVER